MARQIVAEFDAVTGPFLRKLGAIDNSIVRFEKRAMTSMTAMERGMDGLVSSAQRFQAITGLIAGGFGARVATEFLDEAKLIRNALREAGDASQEMFDEVFRASFRSLSGFKEMAAGVQRFQKSLGDRQGIADSIRQLETLNKLLALSGKTAQERASTMIQFSQALQAGYLQGEELRAIRENAPIELTKAIAREAGGSIEDLKDLAVQGKLTTDVMVAALKSLEEEADRRFGAVAVTINDAAKLLRSGAVVAAEGFDEGLGLSRATVASLTQLGKTLGESAEAARFFGEAIKVAGAAMLGSFAGRRVMDVVNGLRASSRARYADAAAADAQVAATRRQVAQASAALTAAERHQLAVVAAGRAESTRAKAIARVQRAQQGLNAATVRYEAALQGAAVAQRNLLLGARALGAAGNVLRGAWAFLGGWPGLILTAASAFYALRASVESSDDRLARLSQRNDTLVNSMTSVRDLSAELARLEDARARAAEGATSRIIAATQREFVARQNLLRLDRRQAQREQAERVRELNALREQLAGMPSAEAAVDAFYSNSGIARGNAPDAATRAEMVAEIEQSQAPVRRDLAERIARLQAAVDLASLDLEESAELLSMSFDEVAADADDARTAVENLADTYRGAASQLDELIAAQAKLQDGLRGAVEAGDDLARGRFLSALAEVDRRLQAMREEGGGVTREIDALSEKAAEMAAMLEAAQFDEHGEIRGVVQDLVESLAQASANVGDLDGQDLDSLYTAVSTVTAIVDSLLQRLGLVREELTKPFAGAAPGGPAWTRAAGAAARGGMLDLIMHAEGTAQTGNPFNTSLDYGRWLPGGREHALTTMTLAEIRELQNHMLAQEANRNLYGEGRGSSALGAFQITRGTLFGGATGWGGLVGELGLSPNDRFDEETQRRLAEQLLRRRRGQGVDGLRNEWEGLRRVSPETITTAMGMAPVSAMDPEVERRLEEAAREREQRAQEAMAAIENDKEAAIAMIESAMTKEEEHAQQVREMLELRAKLVETYGEQSDIVLRLDEAIQRARDSFQDLDDEQRQFWDSMSDHIADSIEDWKGWGNFLRGMLARLVRERGADFITAMLAGGQQGSGPGASFANTLLSGFGSSLGNSLGGGASSLGSVRPRARPWGVMHGGGRVGSASRQRLMPWLPGLAADEVGIIAQRGETIIPKGGIGAAAGGGKVDVTARVFVDENGNWQARVEQISDGRARAHTATAMRQQDRRFGSRIDSFNARGR